MPDSVVVSPDTTLSIQTQKATADTVLRDYKTMYLPIVNDILSDTTKQIYFWRITERTGEIIAGQPDTLLTDFSNRQLVEGQGLSIQYLGNLGLPAQSRIYFERPQRSDFLFQDNYSIYAKSPETFNFINTKIPFSNISYISAGSQQVKEERFTGAMSINFGKKLNVGFDVDYLYARGFYASQAAKRLDWVFYGSYISDRHRLHVFINPSNYTNAENGGITDDRWITDPQTMSGNRSVQTFNIPTRMKETWNRINGTRYYLNYRYNLGFEKETNKLDSLGNKTKQFIPVSSIIYTFDYNKKSRLFNSNDTTNLDTLYKSVYYTHKPLRDSTSYWRLRQTLGISLREGFSQWAKFDLTAFITQDFYNYTIMTFMGDMPDYVQSPTYIGGEIAKRKGKILRYDAHGDFCVQGKPYLGDYNVSGNIETRIPILGDTASLIGSAYFKNRAPTFYENTFRSKYFVWNNDDIFHKTRNAYFGGTLNIPHTKTNLNAGVENISNYIFFNTDHVPEQYSGNIRILTAILTQNMQLGILNWNNQITYQYSSDESKLPLPDFTIYSNLFIQFKVAKVLTIQLGGNVHYFTKYYAPTYEPVTQQFCLQDETEIGNYPLVNAYINCHLKYTRFFIQFYNLSSSFINNPAYFSTPYYPVNPQIIRWGLSWNFNN
ncbi:MAG: putative porin [Candidatus Azobacteroides sp.]|nr:putative porin [Candidatus Azobacteroides sp.]